MKNEGEHGGDEQRQERALHQPPPPARWPHRAVAAVDGHHAPIEASDEGGQHAAFGLEHEPAKLLFRELVRVVREGSTGGAAADAPDGRQRRL